MVTAEGLAGGLCALQRCVTVLEANRNLCTSVICEPQMGRRGLYPTLGGGRTARAVAIRMNLLAYADGTRDLLDIAEVLGEPVWEIAPVAEELIGCGLLIETSHQGKWKGGMTADSDIAKHYDAVAAEYFKHYQQANLRDSASYPANYFRLQILTTRLAQLGLNSVYEVGVGEGTPLATMAAMGFRVAGCDIAQSMVTAARTNFEKRGLDSSVLQWGDIEDSTTIANQLKEGAFDAVVAAGVLPHVRNDQLFLKNIGMFVRSGGKIFIEFRNKLFSLLTFNRYTKDFILEDLLNNVPLDVKEVVAMELDKRLATDLPRIRKATVGGDAPSYDAIQAKFHNPFELMELFQSCGYSSPRLHWYHYHPAPPMLEPVLGSKFREAAMALEHEGSWRGYFLCSAGVVEADRV